ncbi:hypothetical protein PPERSA_04831 [Pseudocohnilembus persalinus]|uniref:Uncharacterized protein n=1 Tax=Pseudocohnilembus persalinus TaxID=266149 RepID=A0A0V0QIS6_PSEPJ|nr:hypothetical protein PPERSA_04831 [Pseudocohnilembus persalinus]|eukprot:KRX02209.1 hypothetical protein PPERSA_04831 [Pseudocohnilembus persalinus]
MKKVIDNKCTSVFFYDQLDDNDKNCPKIFHLNALTIAIAQFLDENEIDVLKKVSYISQQEIDQSLENTIKYHPNDIYRLIDLDTQRMNLTESIYAQRMDERRTQYLNEIRQSLVSSNRINNKNKNQINMISSQTSNTKSINEEKHVQEQLKFSQEVYETHQQYAKDAVYYLHFPDYNVIQLQKKAEIFQKKQEKKQKKLKQKNNGTTTQGTIEIEQIQEEDDDEDDDENYIAVHSSRKDTYNSKTAQQKRGKNEESQIDFQEKLEDENQSLSEQANYNPDELQQQSLLPNELKEFKFNENKINNSQDLQNQLSNSEKQDDPAGGKNAINKNIDQNPVNKKSLFGKIGKQQNNQKSVGFSNLIEIVDENNEKTQKKDSEIQSDDQSDDSFQNDKQLKEQNKQPNIKNQDTYEEQLKQIQDLKNLQKIERQNKLKNQNNDQSQEKNQNQQIIQQDNRPKQNQNYQEIENGQDLQQLQILTNKNLDIPGNKSDIQSIQEEIPKQEKIDNDTKQQNPQQSDQNEILCQISKENIIPQIQQLNEKQENKNNNNIDNKLNLDNFDQIKSNNNDKIDDENGQIQTNTENLNQNQKNQDQDIELNSQQNNYNKSLEKQNDKDYNQEAFKSIQQEMQNNQKNPYNKEMLQQQQLNYLPELNNNEDLNKQCNKFINQDSNKISQDQVLNHKKQDFQIQEQIQPVNNDQYQHIATNDFSHKNNKQAIIQSQKKNNKKNNVDNLKLDSEFVFLLEIKQIIAQNMNYQLLYGINDIKQLEQLSVNIQISSQVTQNDGQLIENGEKIDEYQTSLIQLKCDSDQIKQIELIQRRNNAGTILYLYRFGKLNKVQEQFKEKLWDKFLIKIRLEHQSQEEMQQEFNRLQQGGIPIKYRNEFLQEIFNSEYYLQYGYKNLLEDSREQLENWEGDNSTIFNNEYEESNFNNNSCNEQNFGKNSRKNSGNNSSINKSLIYEQQNKEKLFNQWTQFQQILEGKDTFISIKFCQQLLYQSPINFT